MGTAGVEVWGSLVCLRPGYPAGNLEGPRAWVLPLLTPRYSPDPVDEAGGTFGA